MVIDSPIEDDPILVDFQLARCSKHMTEFQESLLGLCQDLAKEAEVDLSDLTSLANADDGSLSNDVYAVFDFVDFKTTRRKGLLSSSWSPFTIFVRGERVLSLRACYDKKGARVSGVSILVDGENMTSRCRKESVAKKILISHIKTYITQ